MLTLAAARVHCPTFKPPLVPVLPVPGRKLATAEGICSTYPTPDCDLAASLQEHSPSPPGRLPFSTGTVGILMGSWTWGLIVVYFP